MAFWEKTAHARAWNSLIEPGRSCDLGCIGCHTVGFDAPGGYCRLADAERWANVGCESCHGPGAGHVASPDDESAWSAAFTRRAGRETCLRCHTAEHSTDFDFDTYLPRVIGKGHAARGVN